MCSIYGGITLNRGQNLDVRVIQAIRGKARDRGRDGGRFEFYRGGDSANQNGHEVCLGNFRATPTPEIEDGDLQPYDKMVHNGTIANDVVLGAKPGEIDSQALARYIDRCGVHSLAQSLDNVVGSFALLVYNGWTVLGATNYKPLYYARINECLYFSSMARHFEGLLLFGQAPVRVEPYTAIDFLSGVSVSLRPRNIPKKVVVIASAGLDSTVAATSLKRDGYDVALLHFAYGCKAESREVQALYNIGAHLNAPVHVVNLDLKSLSSSTLFGAEDKISGAVAGAEFAHEWVPARNFAFLAVATAWAESHGYHAVALGNNLEEAGAYPDNEEEFTTLLDKAIPYAVKANYPMRVLSPVGNLMKHEIVFLGLKLGAPLEHTWSCYRGADVHCGECGPCFMRKKAFERNKALDPVMQHIHGGVIGA